MRVFVFVRVCARARACVLSSEKSGDLVVAPSPLPNIMIYNIIVCVCALARAHILEKVPSYEQNVDAFCHFRNICLLLWLLMHTHHTHTHTAQMSEKKMSCLKFTAVEYR